MTEPTIMLQVSPDERDLIEQMRLWKDGIPDDALGTAKESGIYISLIAARAELYLLALRHSHNDLKARYDAFYRLIGPNLALSLCGTWQKHQRRLADDREAELMELAGGE
jgi:hypothetical protein